MKVLGYQWENNFSNEAFIQQQTNKARRIWWFLTRQLRTKKRETWIKAYKIYIRPILEYLSPLLSGMTRQQKQKLEAVQRGIVSYIFKREEMSEQQELEASILIEEEQEKEEEIYSQHINTQIEKTQEENNTALRRTQKDTQERSKERSYEEKLEIAELMPLTKRIHRNQLYLIRACLAGEIQVPYIKLAETNSQRQGAKVDITRTQSKSKLATRFFNTSYTQVAALAFNNLELNIRKEYQNKDHFKIKLENYLATFDVLEGGKPLQRTSLFAQLKSFNTKLHRSYTT